MYGFVFGVHDMVYVLRLYVCLVISTWRCYKNMLENILSLQCVNWKDKIKEIKFLEIYLVYWIMNSNSNKFEVEH